MTGRAVRTVGGGGGCFVGGDVVAVAVEGEFVGGGSELLASVSFHKNTVDKECETGLDVAVAGFKEVG